MPEAAFRCPPLPSRPRPGAQQQTASPASAQQMPAPPAASTRQQREAADLHGEGGRTRKVSAHPDQSLVIHFSESPEDEMEASRGRSAPRAISMSPSRSNANPSCSGSDSVAAGSQSTGGRQRRATAAAAMLRIKGKMKPPSLEYGNLSRKHALAAVSAAVSAATSQQPAEGIRDDPSCATSGSAQVLGVHEAATTRATRTTTAGPTPSNSKSTSSRKRGQVTVAEDLMCAEPDRKRLATQGGAVGGAAAVVAKASSTVKGPSSKVHRQGSIKHEPGQPQAAKQGGGSSQKAVSGASSAQPPKGRKAKELVQAVAKGAGACAAAPSQRGRAAVKLKQENARAAAAKGKLLPAAVPAMQASAMPVSSTADVKRKPKKAPAPVNDMFPCGAEAWTDAEMGRLQHVCTHKVQPSSLRYWQQVALHMPGALAAQFLCAYFWNSGAMCLLSHALVRLPSCEAVL